MKAEPAAKGTGQGRFELLGVDRYGQREARAELWEDRLAAVMMATTSVSNGWVAMRLQMGQLGSVT